MTYGKPPVLLGQFDMTLPEVMYYLYLPVVMNDGTIIADSIPAMGEDGIMLPPNVECCRPLIRRAIESSSRRFKYAYLSARKGWATPDNPLNRPGWHCDGFGSEDLNFVWWKGASTRFAIGKFDDVDPISTDHKLSMKQFENVIDNGFRYPETHIKIDQPPAGFLYGLDPYVVHATPELTTGQMRQYVKVSLSDHRYDLWNNSHNYLFDYDWPMQDREALRNDTHSAQRDYSGVSG